MKSYIGFFLLCLIEIVAVAVIIFLINKVKSSLDNQRLISQYPMLIPKTDLITNGNLRITHFYEPKPDIVETWNPEWLGHTIQNTINSDSLNERINYDLQKKSGTYRILTLGDSFTFGAYVDTANNYPEQLEDLLNNHTKCDNIAHFEVINLGYPGYDLAYSLERFNKRGLKYNPDLVIWLINNWNLDNISEYRIPIQEEFVKKGIPVFDPKRRENTAVIMAQKENERLLGKDFIFEYQRKILESFSNVYQGKLLLTSFPNIEIKYDVLINNFIKKSSNYFYFKNLFNIFHDDSYLLIPDHHPNEKGHKIISTDVLNYLFKNVLNQCEYI